MGYYINALHYGQRRARVVMKMVFSLLALSVMVPVLAVAAESSSSWSCWCCCGDDKKPTNIAVASVSPLVITPITVTPAAEEKGPCTLDVAAVTTDEGYSQEIRRLAAVMRGKHLILRQGKVKNNKYTFPFIYRDLDASFKDVVHLHFVIHLGGTIDYADMAKVIQRGTELEELETLVFESLIIDFPADEFYGLIKEKMPGLTSMRINKSEWKRE